MGVREVAGRRLAAVLLSVLGLLTAVAAAAATGDAPGAVMLVEGYARPSVPGATIGAAYVTLRNAGDTDDRLTGVVTPLAESAELRTTVAGTDGTPRQEPVPEGLPLPAGGLLPMGRDGDCIMLFGLDQPLVAGQRVLLRLIFDRAAPLDVTVVVDPTRETGLP